MPCAVVAENQRHAFFDDAVLRRLRCTVGFQRPTWGLFEQPGAYWTFGDLETRLDAPPPLLGEHSRGVLADIGFASRDIAGLVRDGIVVDGGAGSDV